MCISSCSWPIWEGLALRLFILIVFLLLLAVFDFFVTHRWLRKPQDAWRVWIVGVVLLFILGAVASHPGCNINDAACSLGLKEACTQSAGGLQMAC